MRCTELSGEITVEIIEIDRMGEIFGNSDKLGVGVECEVQRDS